MDNLIGKFLDNRYEILEMIGQGGMSVVYRAKCHRLNRMVAVKVLKDEFSGDDEFKNRFQDESLSVAMLSHPNIVAVYDVSKSNDIEYIVMELIDGITLKEYLQKKGHLSWQETIYFSLQIAKALQHAHNRGIIHRDIKPQNIMVLRDGTVKVADFGIAHQVAKQQTYNKGEAIGSVHYVSPEQAKGSRIDNRADIYSLGVVMYEMLTGRLPFEGTNPVDIAIQHIKSVPLSPSDYVPDVPKAIELVTMKAMNGNISQRYANADELISDLDRIRNNPHVNIEVEESFSSQDIIDEEDSLATRKLNYQSDIERLSKKGKVAEDKEEEPTENSKDTFFTRNKNMIFNVSAILIFVFGALFFVINVLNPFKTDDKYTLKVPDLKGQIYEQVIKDERFSKFKITESERVYNDTVPVGAIISQTPEDGRKLAEGEEIKVVVSRGSKSSLMPDFTQMEYRQAEIELDRLGVTYREEWEYNDSVEKNKIISTTPGKEEKITDNLTVVLLISKGKELKNIKMPDLKGLPEEDARKAILEAGLAIGEVSKVDSKEADGIVIFQSVPKGSEVLEQTTIDIQISKNIAPKKIAKIISIPLSEYQGEFLVTVYVNGAIQYDAMHKYSDGVAEIPLVAYEGYNRVKISIGGSIVMDEDMLF